MRPLSLNLETSSWCNRMCPTCPRNVYPDREAVASWFEMNLLPMDTICEALDQYRAMHRKRAGTVCLNHYNEPLLDPRIVDIADRAKSFGSFFVYFITNGDMLTPQMATALDGLLDCIVVSLYGEPHVMQRREALRRMFTKTSVKIAGEHCATHYSPGDNGYTVWCMPSRIIINHRSQFLFCCEDLVGTFDMGTFPETSLVDYWTGEKHAAMIHDLTVAKERTKYPYCTSCPRSL